MSKFEIGDEVVVIEEASNWGYWMPIMAETVGRSGEVVDFETVEGVSYPTVEFGTGEDTFTYFYPDWVLRYAKDWAPEELESTMTILDLFKIENLMFK